VIVFFLLFFFRFFKPAALGFIACAIILAPGVGECSEA